MHHPTHPLPRGKSQINRSAFITLGVSIPLTLTVLTRVKQLWTRHTHTHTRCKKKKQKSVSENDLFIHNWGFAFWFDCFLLDFMSPLGCLFCSSVSLNVIQSALSRPFSILPTAPPSVAKQLMANQKIPPGAKIVAQLTFPLCSRFTCSELSISCMDARTSQRERSTLVSPNPSIRCARIRNHQTAIKL